MKSIPFARIVCDGNERKYLEEVLESGWLTTGSFAARFEECFAEAVAAPHALAVSSCTAALHLALEALNIRSGDTVLLPTLTFTATAEVVRYLGAHPVPLDVDYATGLLTPEIVSEGLRRHPRCRAVIVVHYGGQTARMAGPGGIKELCDQRGVPVVEDAAHAFPARDAGIAAGSLGDVACFSFYANKTITSAEGGMLVTHNEAIATRARLMRLHGINRDAWDRFKSAGRWEYDVVAPGYKYNLPDLCAAVGLAQLERAEPLRAARQRCAAFYQDALEGTPGIDLPKARVAPADHAWHLFPIKLTEASAVDRTTCIEAMSEAGVGTSVHYKPLHRLSYYQGTYDLKAEDFPQAEAFWQRCLSLPIYPSLNGGEQSYVAETLKSLVRGTPPTGRS